MPIISQAAFGVKGALTIVDPVYTYTIVADDTAEQMPAFACNNALLIIEENLYPTFIAIEPSVPNEYNSIPCYYGNIIAVSGIANLDEVWVYGKIGGKISAIPYTI